jgi:Flp pilus assembly protein TadB
MDRKVHGITPKQAFALLNLVWAALAVFVLILFVVAWVLRPPPIDSLNLHIVAVIMGIFSIMILMFQGKLRTNLTDGKLFPRFLDLDSWGLNPASADKLRLLELPERGDQLMLQAHVVFRVLIWVTAMVIAAFGLVLTLYIGRWRFMGLFGIVALTVMFYNYPSYPMFMKQQKRWRGFLETKTGRRAVKRGI